MMITEKQGFISMHHFLLRWYEMTHSNEIGEILSLMELMEDGNPADPEMWDTWIESIKKTLAGDIPPTKSLS